MMRASHLTLLLGLALAAVACDAGEVVLYVPTEAGAGSADSGATGAAGVHGSDGVDASDGRDASVGVDGSTGGSDGTDGAVSDASSGGEDAGAPPDGSTSCSTTADCPATWFCSKTNCGDVTGSCAPRPLICDANVMPVCGCDHITYWNTCLREDYGISADRPGECGANATACLIDTDCGTPGVTCAHLLPSMASCSVSGTGSCWATPNDCATGLDIRHWLACPLPAPGSAPPCVSTCDAIQSGRTHIQAPRGAQCND
jgi:hypothetical protein